jgi:hypothetical protein
MSNNSYAEVFIPTQDLCFFIELKYISILKNLPDELKFGRKSPVETPTICPPMNVCTSEDKEVSYVRS